AARRRPSNDILLAAVIDGRAGGAAIHGLEAAGVDRGPGGDAGDELAAAIDEDVVGRGPGHDVLLAAHTDHRAVVDAAGLDDLLAEHGHDGRRSIHVKVRTLRERSAAEAGASLDDDVSGDGNARDPPGAALDVDGLDTGHLAEHAVAIA